MFSRSKNKPGKGKPKVDDNAKKERVKQFFDIPDMNDPSFLEQGNDEYDSDLEAELLALTQGTAVPTSKGKKGKKAPNLNQMVDECMKDDSCDDLSDEDDPDLLAELSALATEDQEEPMVTPTEPIRRKPLIPDVQRPAPVIVRPIPMAAGPSVTALLKDRKQMYEQAEKNATEAGETSRAKRFKRGLATINQMLKTAESGRVVQEEDIPPAVLLSSSRAGSSTDLTQENVQVPSSISSPDFLSTDIMMPTVVPSGIYNKQTYEDTSGSDRPNILINTDNVSSPRTAVVPIPVKQCLPSEVTTESRFGSSTLSAVTERQLEYKSKALNAKKRGDIEEAMRLMKVAKQMQPMVDAAKEGKDIDVQSLPPPPPSKPVEVEAIQTAPAAPHPAPVPSSDKPLSTLETLQQRLTFYEQQRDKAKAADNARKERMNQRISKQYQEAITQVKTGRLMDFSELPTPPGFPPIPITNVSPNISEPSASGSRAPPDPSNGPSPKQLKPNPVSAGSSSKVQVTPNVRNAPKSRVERQLSVLQKRQQLFKEAALESKKKGEIEQAKEYLRNSRGFDQLILASQGGLPVDMNTAPIPPQEVVASFAPVSDFEVIVSEDCEIMPTKTAADMAVVYTKLEDELISQIKMCARTREHFKAVGDVASANRFEQLILHTKKDLDSVRVGFKRGDTPPKFHYETRSFTMIQCNTELNDSDLEVVIVRGINYNVPNPKEVHTYVKVEFPYPTESPPQDKTDVVKDTNCPEYNHKFLFSIDRKLRSLARIFKRQTVKCQVINKGSWYHRDNVLGSVKIPLIHLENKCTHHESYDLTDDRKKMVGGKLEVKIRARNPILSKQLEKISEKWLVIDGF